MIRYIPINVSCHSGFKADEYPKYFSWNEREFEINGVIDRWYQGDTNPILPVSNYFKVNTTSGEQFIIKHNLRNDKWYLCVKTSDTLAG